MRSTTWVVCIAALLSLSNGCGGGPSDEQIVAEIDRQLVNSPMLGGAEIDVSSRGGVVTLSGVVASEEQRAHAESLASGVEGVDSVESQLEVASVAPVPPPDVAAPPPEAPQPPM
jgi:osmotically-inducible protein OsmY